MAVEERGGRLWRTGVGGALSNGSRGTGGGETLSNCSRGTGGGGGVRVRLCQMAVEERGGGGGFDKWQWRNGGGRLCQMAVEVWVEKGGFVKWQ